MKQGYPSPGKFRRAARAVTLSSAQFGPEKWWRHLEEAKAFKAQHGHCYFSQKTPLGKWLKQTRMSWSKGNLDASQIAALKESGIKRMENPSPTKGASMIRKTTRIDQLLSLRERIERGEASTEETKLAEEITKEFRDSYNNGSLSPATARRLGFNIKPGQLAY